MNSRAAAPRWTTTLGPRWRWPVRALGASLLVLGAASLGCSGAATDDGLPLLTIAECQDLGGAPLFDPEDERPIQESCPDGLYFTGVFDEEFFGAEGGICCAGPDTAPS